MSYNHHISDFIAKLNVASRSHFISIGVKRSKIIINILKLLYENGVIRGYVIFNESIIVYLKYYHNKSVFTSLQIVSSPSKRVYWSLNKLHLRYNNNNFSGFYIISTDKGLMTSTEALLISNVSGEIILKITV